MLEVMLKTSDGRNVLIGTAGTNPHTDVSLSIDSVTFTVSAQELIRALIAAVEPEAQ